MTVRCGLVVRRRINFRDHRGIAQSHRTAGGDIHVAPKAHVLVGRRRVPVDKRDRQVGVGGREDLHRENVGFSRRCGIGNIEFVGAPCAGNVVRFRDLLPIQPNVGAIIDSAKVKPDGLSLVARRAEQNPCDTTRAHKTGCPAASGCSEKLRRWDKSLPATTASSCRRSGRDTPCAWPAPATTVVGTLTPYHPLVWNLGVEIISPFASTLHEDCSVQPSLSAREALGDGGWLGLLRRKSDRERHHQDPTAGCPLHLHEEILGRGMVFRRVPLCRI